MKRILFSIVLLVGVFTQGYGQEYCSNFRVVSIFDFPPAPLTPGGNYFLLLLTIDEDNMDNLDIYSNLFFVDGLGDTISIPTGPSSHLPLYATDTIPYLLRLNTVDSNQDFPESFDGHLVIHHSIQPVCEVAYSNVVTSNDDVPTKNAFNIYPNPFVSNFAIDSDRVMESVSVFNSSGITVKEFFPCVNLLEVDMNLLSAGSYLVRVVFKDGTSLVRAIVKI